MKTTSQNPQEQIKEYQAHPNEMIRALEGSLVRHKNSARAAGVTRGDLHAITYAVVERLRTLTQDPALLKHLRTLRAICKSGETGAKACKQYEAEDKAACKAAASAMLTEKHPATGITAALAFALSDLTFRQFSPVPATSVNTTPATAAA